MIELDQAERFHDLVPQFTPGDLPLTVLEGESHVAEDGHVRPDGVGLKNHPDISLVSRHDNPLAAGENFVFADGDYALIGFFQTRDTSKGRRFSAAARPQKGIKFSFPDLEADTPDRLNLATVTLDEIFYL